MGSPIEVPPLMDGFDGSDLVQTELDNFNAMYTMPIEMMYFQDGVNGDIGDEVKQTLEDCTQKIKLISGLLDTCRCTMTEGEYATMATTIANLYTKFDDWLDELNPPPQPTLSRQVTHQY